MKKGFKMNALAIIAAASLTGGGSALLAQEVERPQVERPKPEGVRPERPARPE